MMPLTRVNRLPLIGVAIMVVLSFGNFTGRPLASIVVPFGIVFFFIQRAIIKDPLERKMLAFNLSLDVQSLVWLLLPAMVTVLNVAISANFFPAYIEYETQRAGQFVAIELSFVTILLFFVFALGEEIAWRAFFQHQIMRWVSPVFAILFSSFLFTLGHFEMGNPALVIYGLTFTFINSCLYGWIFYKTQNVWLSTIAHFMANLVEVFLYTI